MLDGPEGELSTAAVEHEVVLDDAALDRDNLGSIFVVLVTFAEVGRPDVAHQLKEQQKVYIKAAQAFILREHYHVKL